MRLSFALAGAAILAAGVLAPAPAEAVCNVFAGCSCTATASGVGFGSYNPVATTALDSVGTVRVQCTQNQPRPLSFTVSLGAGASGSYAARRMAGGGSQLQYNLYRDAPRAQIWGNGTGGSTVVTRSFNGSRVVDDTISVYGRVPAGQNVAAGAYADTITVTVTY